jgi:hypothetical protein
MKLAVFDIDGLLLSTGLYLFSHPPTDQFRICNPSSFSDPSDGLRLFRFEIKRNHRRRFEDGLSDFFQLILKVRQIVRVPKLSQLLNRISLW